ncbi:MAG TPA: CRISPR-associated endonuclease Cas1 [Candidatus Tumulicola sp.]|jgi:CRISPR-associated protein Cas1
MTDTILTVDGYNASLNVERGHLIVRDGFTQGDRREIRFPRGRCRVNRIVVRAPGGTVTMDAIRWCADMGIALSFMDSDSRLLNCMVPDAPHDGPVKRAQAISAVTDDAPHLARYLLGKKMDSQIHAMERDFPRLGIGTVSGNSASTAQVHACKAGLSKATTLVDFLGLEGRAAQFYWDVLVETPLPWRPWALSRIPAHWAAISPRTSGRRDRVRDATDPFNAVLNYAYTLLEVETRIACEAVGLDPDLGLIHIDDRLRESFIYDLLEPLRAKADVWALELLRKETMRPVMFHELRDGIVRLDPDLAGLLAKSLMPRFRSAALDLSSDYAKQLRRITVQRRLLREAPKPIEQRRDMCENSRCGYCKERLPRKRLKYCGRTCYLKYSTEVARPIEKAHARLAELRASGLSPGHGGEAAKRRGSALSENNRLGITGRRARPVGENASIRSKRPTQK